MALGWMGSISSVLYWLLFSLPFCLGLSQLPFTTGKEPQDTSPFIFNSLFGLLKQWPNTLHPNGHSIVPVTIAPQTLLYHARTDIELPGSPEWFGLSPELGFGLVQMAPGGAPTYMLTYRAVRPLKALVFDGLSAYPTKLDVGFMDGLATFIYGAGQRDTGNDRPAWGGLVEEYQRAKMLCELADAMNIDGFIRMNTGFELIWCDFNSSAIELISNLNVTPPHHTTHHSSLNLDPGTPDAPVILPFPFFSLSSFHEWARIYTTYNMASLPFLTLHPAGMVTYYNPRLLSLAESRSGEGMARHRIWPSISKEDAMSVRSEVEDVVQRGFGVGSGTDWVSLARLIVENWAHRIAHLRHVLSTLVSAPSSSINITRSLEEIQLLSYSPLMPYMDATVGSKTGQDFVFSPSPFPPHESGLDRCGSQYTKGLPLDALTDQERLLKQSIDTVQRRICLDIGTVFAQSRDFSHSDLMPIDEALASWLERISDLSKYLDWPTDIRCEEVCPFDSVCGLPLWPFEPLWPELHVDLVPACQKIDVFGGPETWRKLWTEERFRSNP